MSEQENLTYFGLTKKAAFHDQFVRFVGSAKSFQQELTEMMKYDSKFNEKVGYAMRQLEIDLNILLKGK